MRLFCVITIISTFALAGCATSKQTYTADGRIGHSIDCSGGFATWGSCYEKAGGLCGAKGYDVLEKLARKMRAFRGPHMALAAVLSISAT